MKSVSSPGSVRKRVTVSVAVDGHWEPDSSRKGAKPVWKPRSPEEIAQLTQLVQNAVGAQPGSDNVFVTCVKFDNPVVAAALEDMGHPAQSWTGWIRWAVLGLSVIAGLLLLRSLVRVVQEATDPPRPAYADLELRESDRDGDEEIIQEGVRVNDLLFRLENMTKAEPASFSKLVRSWLLEGSNASQERTPKKGR